MGHRQGQRTDKEHGAGNRSKKEDIKHQHTCHSNFTTHQITDTAMRKHNMNTPVKPHTELRQLLDPTSE